MSEPDLMKEQLKEVLITRGAHIESFSAAFLKEVGSEEASKYYLEETHDRSDGYRITWEFKLKSTND